jgi:orotate phosphoribosyltransferase
MKMREWTTHTSNARQKVMTDFNAYVRDVGIEEATNPLVDSLISYDIVQVPKSTEPKHSILMPHAKRALKEAGINTLAYGSHEYGLIIQDALDRNIIKQEGLTPYFFHLGNVPGVDREATDYMAMLYANRMMETGKTFERIISTPNSSIPYGALAAQYTDLPVSHIQNGYESEKFNHITGGLDRHHHHGRQPIAVFDDLVSDGELAMKAIKKIANHGGIVQDLFVALDREEGASERLRKFRVNLHPFLNMNQIRKRIYENPTIADDVKQFIKDRETLL